MPFVDDLVKKWHDWCYSLPFKYDPFEEDANIWKAILRVWPWLNPNHGENHSPHAIDRDHYVEEDFRLEFKDISKKYNYKYD